MKAHEAGVPDVELSMSWQSVESFMAFAIVVGFTLGVLAGVLGVWVVGSLV